MVKWENWADAGSRKFFPNLQKLQINRCYNLKELPFMALGAAIKVLSLSGCGSYSGTVSSYLHRLTCLTHLNVNDCSQKFVLPCQHLVALEYLHLSNCKALCFEGGILCLKSLKNLHISSCRIMTSSLDGEMNHILSNQALRLRKNLQFNEASGKGKEIHLPGSPVAGLTKGSGKKRKEISRRASIAGLHGTTRIIIRESPQKDEGIHVMLSLTHLTMDNLSLSLNLDNILSKLSVLRTLCLYKLHKISVLQEQWLEQIKSLQELEFSCCYFLRKLPSNLSTLSTLKKLSLQSCSQIHSLPSKGLPGNLKELQILGCSPILQARCQKIEGETWAKKIGDCPKGSIIEHRLKYEKEEELNEFWQGWLKYEKEWVQCDEEQLKNTGEWLKNEEEDWLKNSAEELENNEDVWIKPTGEDWPKIAHIPYIRVNGDIIQNLYL